MGIFARLSGVFHGFPMGPVGVPWDSHGQPAVQHKNPMEDPWETHGRPMGDAWASTTLYSSSIKAALPSAREHSQAKKGDGRGKHVTQSIQHCWKRHMPLRRLPVSEKRNLYRRTTVSWLTGKKVIDCKLIG